MSECLQERTTEMPAIGRLSSSMVEGTLAASGKKQLHLLNRHNSSQRLMAMQYHKSIPVDGKPLTPNPHRREEQIEVADLKCFSEGEQH